MSKETSMKKVFSLNHDSIGTRFSGSYCIPSGMTERDFERDALDFNSGQSFMDWKEGATVGGSVYYVDYSVYWARVE